VTDTARLVREATRIWTRGAELPGATLLTLAHRLPLLWLANPGAWHQAELWRMCLEKPLVAGHVWASWSLAPLRFWLAVARGFGPRGSAALPLELATLATAAVGDAIAPVHRRVTRNARRLSRRHARQTARRPR
jgi:hypothetical protein